jgi:hypothetical protein
LLLITVLQLLGPLATPHLTLGDAAASCSALNVVSPRVNGAPFIRSTKLASERCASDGSVTAFPFVLQVGLGFLPDVAMETGTGRLPRVREMAALRIF